jgi:hypothetical protein
MKYKNAKERMNESVGSFNVEPEMAVNLLLAAAFLGIE